MTPFVKTTATNLVNWVREAATIINLINARVDVIEALPLQVFRKLAAAPSSPVEGDVYFDTVLKKHRGYDGTAWQNFY